MRRRALLRSLAALAVLRPAARARGVRAQAGSAFTTSQAATLRALAEAGLPSAIGDAGRTRAVSAFMAWHREYRAGADRGHGYGSGRLSAPSGPPPADRYAAQFDALDAAAVAAGAASFALAPIETRRAIAIRALDEPRVGNLPSAPTGANLVADLLGFYFNSADAWDLAYEADIRRDSCRSLAGSDQPPARRS